MNKNHRYPGIRPFTFDDKNLFFGRDEDIDNLCQMIYLERLVVLYGKSGLGKTSLLNAGVVPKLQQDMDITPYMIRFGSNMEGKNLTPLQILRERLATELDTDNYLGNIISNPDALWYYFKHLQINYGPEKHFLLVFDQFEELFTYSDQAIYEFKREIASITNNNIPKSFKNKLRELLENGENALTEDQLNLLYLPLNVKIVMAIRSDRMSLLDKFKDYLPDILQKCYELEPLSISQAKMAIIEPAQAEGDFSTLPFTYEPTALRKILRYLSNDNTQKIESFQLQIICQNMEEYTSENKVDNITLSDVGDLNLVIKNYYDHQIELIGTPEEQYATRILIEEGLIFEPEERRLSLYEGQIYRNYNISEELLNRLVQARLLRAEPNTAGGFSYELCHDTLVSPILKSKAKRKEAERKEAERIAKLEAEKAERERRAKIRRRYLTVVGTFAVAALISLGFAIWAFRQKAELQITNQQIELQNQEIAANLKALEEKEKQLEAEKQTAILARDEAEIRRIEAEQAKLEAERAKQLALLANIDLESARLSLEEELNAKAGEFDRFKKLLDEYWFNPSTMGAEDFNYALKTLLPLMREDTTLGGDVLKSLRFSQKAREQASQLKFQYYFAKKALDLKPDNKIADSILNQLAKEVILPNQSNELPFSDYSVRNVALSPDNETLVMATDKSLQLHDANNPNGIPHKINLSSLSPVKAVVFAPDGKQFATLHEYSFEAHIWDNSNLYNPPTKPTFSIVDSNYVSSIAFSPDNGYITTGNEAGQISQYDRRGNFVRTLISEPGYYIDHLQYHPRADQLMAIVSGKGKLYDLKELKEIQYLDYAKHLAADKSGNRLAKADLSSVYLYEKKQTPGNTVTAGYQQTKSYHVGETVQKVYFTEDEKYIIAQGYKIVYIIDPENEELKAHMKLYGHDSQIVGIQIRSGAEIIACRSDAKLNIWNCQKPTPFSEEKINELSPLTISDKYQQGMITFEEVLENGTQEEKSELAGHFMETYYGYNDNYEKAVQLDSNNYKIYQKLGENAYYDGDYEEAITNLEKANEIKENDTDVLHFLGLAHYAQGNFEESVFNFLEVERVDPGKANYYYIGLSSVAAKKFDQAETYLDKYIQQSPNSSDGYNVVGLLYMNQNQYDKAIEYFNQAIGFDSLSYYPYRNIGNVNYKKGLEHKSNSQYQQARAAFQEAVKYYEKALSMRRAYDYIYETGQVYYEMGEYKKALEYYREALKINPDYESAYVGMIHVFFKDFYSAPFEEIIDVHNKLLEIRPRDKGVYHDRGRMYFNHRDYEKAIADYSTAIEIDSVYYLGYANRGMVYDVLGEYENAMKDYSKALEIRKNEIKNFPEAYTEANLVWIIESINNVYLGQHQYQKAVDNYKQIYDIYQNQSPPNDSLIANSCGNMSFYLLLANQPVEAGQYAEEGLKIWPSQRWIYTNLALSYLLTGKKEKAFKIYREMKDEIYVEGNQPYGEIFLDDFNLLQEAGVPIPHLEEAKAIIQGKK